MIVIVTKRRKRRRRVNNDAVDLGNGSGTRWTYHTVNRVIFLVEVIQRSALKGKGGGVTYYNDMIHKERRLLIGSAAV